MIGSDPVEGVDQAVGAGAGGVVFAARPDRGDPDGPPQVGLVRAGGHAVGADDGAVQVEVGVPGRRSPLQRGGQVGGVVGQDGQSLVRIAVGGRHRNAVVPGELDQPGAVDEPAQHEHRLPEDAQRAGSLAGPEPLAVSEQQFREVLGGRPADIEHGGVGGTGRHVEPLVVRNVIFADPFLPGASLMSGIGSPSRRLASSRTATVTLPRRPHCHREGSGGRHRMRKPRWAIPAGVCPRGV